MLRRFWEVVLNNKGLGGPKLWQNACFVVVLEPSLNHGPLSIEGPR